MTDFSVAFSAAASVFADPSHPARYSGRYDHGPDLRLPARLDLDHGRCPADPSDLHDAARPGHRMMLGCYVGGVSGGAIPAVLLSIPGTAGRLHDHNGRLSDGPAGKGREGARLGGLLLRHRNVLQLDRPRVRRARSGKRLH